MSYNNENDLETLNILIIAHAMLRWSEIVIQGAFKSCISLDALHNFVCTLVKKNNVGWLSIQLLKGKFLI